MARRVLVLMLGASLVGCAAHRTTEQGYAMPGDARDAERGASKRIDDRERSEAWSVRDFTYPRGLVW